MGGGAAAGGDLDVAFVNSGEQGWRGLYHNKKCLGLACFASLGGVLYGYNQVCSGSSLQIGTLLISPKGVFGSVQVMAEFEHRYRSTVRHLTYSVV
jgi:hypothetical protein